MSDTWDPEIYDRFHAERMRPALELLDLLEPVEGGRVVDLGCGSGEITRSVHEMTRAATTLGIDTSEAMLARAQPGDGIVFEQSDLASFKSEIPYDLVWANASLQWVPDHKMLLPKVWSFVAPGGQLAIQVPANFGHPSHTVADRLGRHYGLDPLDRTESVLAPASYATLLHGLGADPQRVSLRVYDHPLEATSQVIDWVSGSLLTHYRRALGDERFERFRDDYRRELLAELGDPAGDQPYFYAFERILIWAKKP